MVSKNPIADLTSSSGVGRRARTWAVCQRRVISSRRRRRSAGVLARGESGIVKAIDELVDPPQGDEQGAAPGLRRVCGEDGVDGEPRDQARHVLRGQPGDHERLDGGCHALAGDAACGRPLLATDRPHVALLLGEVDQEEVDGEGTGEQLESLGVEQVEPGHQLVAECWIATPPQCDRREAHLLDQVEEVTALLLDEDLPEERPEEPDLAAEGVSSGGGADAAGFGADRGVLLTHGRDDAPWTSPVHSRAVHPGPTAQPEARS